MSYITANVSKMFAHVEPCYVSGSQAELGQAAGTITWRNALEIASRADDWLLSDRDKAAEGMREWADSTGAWDDDEIASWSDDECLGLFVQNIASELRMLGSDECTDLEDLAKVYESTDWDKRPEYPVGSYSLESGDLQVQWYTGC